MAVRFLLRECSFQALNPGFQPNSSHGGFQKFDSHNPLKFEGQFEQKFPGLQSPYESARISKFEPRFEPNLSTESGQLCQTSRPGSGQSEAASILVQQNGQCGPIP